MIERPLDFLNANKGKSVKIFLKNGIIVTAILLAFDIHINLVIEEKGEISFVKGDNVVSVSANKENKK